MTIKEFILEHWKNTIREMKEDVGHRFALPYPFTVPSEKDYFQEMYYWDTYFINVGLFESDLTQQAIYNCENVSYVIEKHGFMPNCTFVGHINEPVSQPPYFAFMVKDIYAKTGDDDWLKSKYFLIKKEYEWWMENRCTEIGLNRYGNLAFSNERYERSSKNALSRVVVAPDVDIIELGKANVAICESGWDWTPRFGFTPMYSCPIDLNSYLYFYEIYLDSLQKKFGIEDGIDWLEKAKTRKALINQYLWNEEDQIYVDYNFVTGKQYECRSAAAFVPFFVGLADNDKLKGLENSYRLFMKDYGVVCTDKDYGHFQWSYPNGWAPVQYIAFHALNNYGKWEQAKEVATKYMKLCEKLFDEKHDLYEKYNVIDGNDITLDESKVHHTMMGWTAGVYMYFQAKVELKN